MSANDKYVLFDQVAVPSTWGNEMAEKTFKINVAAELIQAKNFEDAELERDGQGNIIGWGSVKVEALEASESK